MLVTRLMIAEKLIATLQSEKKDLEQQLDKLNASLNKKAPKLKEENTF
jgi:chaperonin cofactor prefoldin